MLLAGTCLHCSMTLRIDRIEGTVMAVNSYLLHGPAGVVVVDGQLTISDARAVRAAVDATGAGLAGVLITHPHPDHYAGAGLIADPDVPIVATEEVAAVIARDDALKNEIVAPMMGAQWPPERRFPDRLVTSGQSIQLAGLAFTVRDLGPGESHADSIWSTGGAWFIGDLLCPNLDAYLADGHYTHWLDTLDLLAREAASDTAFYPGHGAPADRGAIAAQRDYLAAFVEAVTAAADLDPAQRRARVIDRMTEMVSDHRLQFLMELSIEPLAATLTQRRGTTR